MTKVDLDATFRHLRAILAEHEPHLVVVSDEAGHYYLDTAHLQPNKKPLFFGAVRTGKQQVSYHLMPVYTSPDLLDGISDELRRRLHGKSCFNFKRPDPGLFGELAALTQRGLYRYRERGYMRSSV